MAESNPFAALDSAPSAAAPAADDDNPFRQFDTVEPPQPAAPSGPPPAPEQNMPGVSVIGDAEMKDFLDAFQAQNIREGTEKLNDSRGRQFIDGLTTLMQHDLELAKGAPSGAVSGVGTLMKGAQTISNAFPSRQLDVMDQIDAGDLKAAQHLHPSLAGYGQMTPAQREMARERLKRMTYDLNVVPVDQQPLYKAGEAVKKFAKTILPAAPGFEEAWSRQVSEGLGQMMVSIPVQLIGGAGFAGALYGVQGAGEAAERAVEYDRKERAAGRPGLTQEDIVRASIWGIGPGATDLLPIEMMLGRLRVPPGLAKPTAKVIGKLGGAAFWRITGQALVEGGQEGFQQALQNLIAKEYNPSQSLGEDILPSAGVGAGVGGVAQAGKEMAQLALRRFAGRRGGSAPSPSPSQAAPTGAPQATATSAQAPSETAKAPTSQPAAAAAPQVQRDAAPETRAATREQFNQYLALEDRLASIPDDMDAPPDLINQAIDAEEAMVESFRVTGLPGDGLARGTRPIESMEDVKRAFDEATPEEINEFWQGKAVGPTASGAVAGAGAVAQGGPAGQARAAASPQESSPGSSAAGASPALRLEKAVSSGGATVYDAKIDDVVHAQVSIKLHPKDKSIEVLGIGNDRKQGRLKPEFVNKIKAALAQEFPDYETAFGKDVGESAPLRPAARDLTTDFLRLIATPTPRDQWAKTLGVSEDELMPHVERAISSGLLRVDRNGVVRRNASAVAEMEPEVEAEGQKIEAAIESGHGSLVAPGIIEGENVTLTPKAIDKIELFRGWADEALQGIRPVDLRIEVVDNIAIDRLAHEDNLLARQFASRPTEEGGAPQGQQLVVAKPGVPQVRNVADFRNAVDQLKEKLDIATRPRRPRDPLLSLRSLPALVQELKEGSRIQLVATHVRGFKDDTQAIIGVAEQHINIDIAQLSATDRETFLDSLSDLQQMVQDRLQMGYRVAEELDEVNEKIDDIFSKLEEDISNVKDDADAVLDDMSDRVDELEEVIAKLEEAGDATAIARSEAEDAADGELEPLEAIQERAERAVAPYSMPDYPDHFTLTDVASREVERLNRLVGEVRGNFEALKQANIDGKSAAELEDVQADLSSAASPAKYLRDQADALEDILSAKRNEAFDQIDAIKEELVLPDVQRMEELADEIEARIDEIEGRETLGGNVSFSLRSSKSAKVSEGTEGESDESGLQEDSGEAGQAGNDASQSAGEGAIAAAVGGGGASGASATEGRILRQESATLRADGSIRAGRVSGKAAALGGLDAEALQPVGTSEFFDAPGLRGVVTAMPVADHAGLARRGAPASEYRLANLTYRLYAPDAPLTEAQLTNFQPNFRGGGDFHAPSIWARVSQHMDGTWEVSMVQRNAGTEAPKGLSAQLYAAIEKDLGIRMSPSGILSKEGLKMWQKRSPESVKWHQWSKSEGYFISPRRIKDNIARIGMDLADIAARPDADPNKAEDHAIAMAERKELIKLWSKLPEEARGATPNTMFSLRTAQDSQIMERAAAKYGVTRDPNEAGYILPDGRMLDFSGRSEISSGGATSRGEPFSEENVAGKRWLDHRDLDGVMDLTAFDPERMPLLDREMAEQTARMYDFMAQSGAVRYRQDFGFEVTAMPSPMQLRTILRHHQKEYSEAPLRVDVTDPSTGNIIASKAFPRPMLDAVSAFLREHYPPNTMFSLRQSPDQPRTATEAKAFHGTPNGALERFRSEAASEAHDGAFFFTSHAEGTSPYTGEGFFDSPFIGDMKPTVYPTFVETKGFKEIDWKGQTHNDGAGPSGGNLNDEMALAKKEGFPGIVVKNMDEAGGAQDWFITWTPGTVRSALSDQQMFAMRSGSATEALGQTNPDAKIISIGARAIEAESRATGKSEKKITIETARHEALEFFLAKGFIRPDEWATLVDVAVDDGWVEAAGVREPYTKQFGETMDAAQLEDLILKESIMVKYGEYERGNYEPKGLVAKVFKRIKDFLDRLRNSLKTQGFQRWEDIFQKMDAGEMRQRYEARFGRLAEAAQTRVTSKAVPAGGKSAMTIKKGAKAAPFSPGMPTAKAGTAASAPGSLVDIQRELRRKLGLTVASGRLDPKMALAAGQMGEQLVGQFDEKTNVIRLKALQDIDAEAHEVAHALEGRYGGLAGLQQTHSAELGGVANLTGQTGPSEGFAEFFRLYLTNPPAADAHAPKFRAAFEDFLETQDAQTLQDIQEIQAQYQQWRNASSAGRITAAVKSGVPQDTWEEIQAEYKKGGMTRVKGMFSAFLDRIYKNVFDKSNPIRVWVQRLAEIAQENNQDIDLSAAFNPHMQAGKIPLMDAAAHMDITKSVAWANSAGRGSVSLVDALATAFGGRRFENWTPEQRDAFGAYLIARRGRWLWQRYDMDPARNRGRMANPPLNPQNGDWYFDTMTRQRRVYLRGRWEAELTRAPDKHTRADHEMTVAELEATNPSFSVAAQMVYQFNRDLALKRFQAGLDSQEEFDYKNGTGDYVPWFRDMTDQIFSGTAASGRKVKQKFKLRGSYRDFINPIEGIIRQVYDTNREIAVNKPKLLMAQLADRVKGAGQLAEIIPATRMEVQEVRIRDALAQAAREEGIPPEDAKNMISAVAALMGDDAVAKIFKTKQAGEGGDAILHYMEGGEMKMLQLHDDGHGIARDIIGFFEATKHTPASDWLFGALGAIVRVPTKLVTSSIEFAYNNLIRDTMSSAVLQAGFFPVVSQYRTIKDNRARRARGEETWGELLARHGGIMGGLNTTHIRMSRQGRILDLGAEGAKYMPWDYRFWTRTVNDGFWKIIEAPEGMTRQTLARIAFDRAIKDVRATYPNMPADQQTFVALEAAAQKSRDYVDYSRMGDLPSILGLIKVVSFLNPSLQGTDKSARAVFRAQDDHGRYQMANLIRERLAPLADPRWMSNFKDGPYQGRKSLTKSEINAAKMAFHAWVAICGIAVGHLMMEILFNDEDELDDKSSLERAASVSFTINGIGFRIPRGFDIINVVSNALRATYSSWKREDPTAWRQFRGTLATSLMPPTSSPLLDLYIGWKHERNNFFNSPIEQEHQQGLLPEDRYTAYTSNLSRRISEALNPLAPFDISPVMAEYSMNAIGSQWSRDILRAYDIFDPNKPAVKWQDYPFLRGARGLRGSRGSEQFWELMGQEGSFAQVAGSYTAKEAKNWDRDKIRKFFDVRLKDDDAKAYAIMMRHYDAEQRRLHPLYRAHEFATAVSSVMRDVASNNIVVPITSKMDRKADTSREVRGQAMDILAEINRREYRNALIALRRPGYENRTPQPVKPYLNELKALSPDIHKALMGKIVKSKGTTVYDYDRVREQWPDTRQKVLAAEKRERIIESEGDVEFHDLTARAQGAKAMGIR